jgi:hypothetical protein
MLPQSIECPDTQVKMLSVQKEIGYREGQETLLMNVQMYLFCFLFLAAELRLGC